MSITNYEQEKFSLAGGKNLIVYKKDNICYISVAAVVRYVCNCSQGAAEMFIVREVESDCVSESVGAAMTVFLYDVSEFDTVVQKLSSMRQDAARIEEIQEMLRSLKMPKKNVLRPESPECQVKEIVRDVHVDNAKAFFESKPVAVVEAPAVEKKEEPSVSVKKSWNSFQQKLRKDNQVKEKTIPVEVVPEVEPVVEVQEKQEVAPVVPPKPLEVIEYKEAEPIRAKSTTVIAKNKAKIVSDRVDDISAIVGTQLQLVEYKMSGRISPIKVYVDHKRIILAVDAPSVVNAINPYGHYDSLTYGVRTKFVGNHKTVILMDDFHDLCDCVIQESPLSKYQRSRAIQISCLTSTAVMLSGGVTTKERVDVIVRDVPNLDKILSDMTVLYTALQGASPTNAELKVVFTNLNKDIKSFIGSL